MAINVWEGIAPHPSFFRLAPACFSPLRLAPMVSPKRFSAAEKGKASKEGPASPPPKRGRGRPRKHPAVPPAASRGRGRAPPKGSVAPGARDGTSSRGGGYRPRSSPHDEGRRAVIVRPPRPRFSLLDVLPEFMVWSESPAGTSLRLPRFFSGELPSLGLAGLWLQADGCCSRASWVSTDVSASGSMVLRVAGRLSPVRVAWAEGAPSTSSTTAWRPST